MGPGWAAPDGPGPRPLLLLPLLLWALQPDGARAQTDPTAAPFHPTDRDERPMPVNYSSRAYSCWYQYEERMVNIHRQDRCLWDVISRPYSELQSCLELGAEERQLGYPNPLAEDIILHSHFTYFANCSLVRPAFGDPPEDLLLAMIIAPICLIPFLVTLVVWRSKDGETQA
ncbi:receptor activity-modifying protein 2 [Tachyglossus aculeatus]|uniref:receptor activity-modifying protein 2 n=1 Tax=Tachyglossus aculeatus TaxID=9261 RepID=UPI0018F5F1F1|nr:receptor activity-modifying protein 2 [Tachyglossus aculeatus]